VDAMTTKQATQNSLVPTRRVGMTLHRAAVRDAARLYCIPTQRVGTSSTSSSCELGELVVGR
jgi:hypothetical protein